MNAPHFHGKARAITASAVLEAIGDAIADIRREDHLRWSDIGEVLGKSEDQAAKYADGSATIDAISLAKGWRVWGSRFIGPLHRLIDKDCGHLSCGQTQHRILEAALAIEAARETHGDITIDEIRANRSALENARDAVDALLARLGGAS